MRDHAVLPVSLSLPGSAAVPPVSAPRTYDRVFVAEPSQVGAARRFLADALGGCPMADDALLCLSELASNSVLHSNSKKPGGTFTVRAEVHDGDYLWLEVEDSGGPWEKRDHRDGRPHGLDIVRALAADTGRDGDPVTGWVMWARLDWPAPASDQQAGLAPPPVTEHPRCCNILL
jgi:Histidine kinase-like ATPase domain